MRIGGDQQGLKINIALCEYQLTADAIDNNQMEAAKAADARFEAAREGGHRSATG